jgi:type IX secretion system PorP/SprF family membrane protein
MKNTWYVFAVVFLFPFLQVEAQQYPSIGFFSHGQLLFNPAYAGSGEGVRGMALYRAQWSGVQGAPQTQLVNVDAPVGRGIGLGLSMSHDKFYSYRQYDINPNVSYRVNIGPESYVQAGLRLGVSIVNFGQDIFQWDSNDPLKDNEVRNGVVTRVGTGLFYKSPKWFAGVSAPDIVSVDSKKVFTDNTGSKTITKNYIVTAGGRVNLSEYITFVPNVLFRYYSSRPTYVSLNAGFEFNQTVLFGVGYLYPNGIAAYTLIGLTPKLKAGYRFEYSPSAADIGKFSTSEIMISYGLY